jgi:hypothetical protein
MYTRQFRPDKSATKAAKFKSRYSYISFRIHPNSDPPQQCRYLAGLDDIGAARLEVFERDEYTCVDCGVKVGWNNGHLAHGGNTKISRCLCAANLKTKCKNCHLGREHNREVKFGEAWYRT